MAMQSGAMAVPEKIPVQWYNQPPHHHQVDEREVFMMWLRGEFAAANAIIDALCHHLRAVAVLLGRGCCLCAAAGRLEAAAESGGVRGRCEDGGSRIEEFRRGGRGQTGGLEGQNFGAEMNGKDLNNGFKSNLKVTDKLDEGDNKAKVEEKEEKEVMGLDEKSEENGTETTPTSTQEVVAHADVEADNTGSCSADGSGLLEKLTLEVSPKSFVATEICDRKPVIAFTLLVNIAEGLKLYEDLFDGSEILKLNNLVNDLRAAGKRGQLQGQTFVALKRPMIGHGFTDASLQDEGASGTSRDSFFIAGAHLIEVGNFHRKQPGIAIGRLCEKCDGKCVICDSYVRPCTLVRVCDECNYGSFQGRCVICGGVGVSDAYYCKECNQQEKDRDGCPKIINLGSAKTDMFYERKKYGFKKR
ncbi:hypothetical protein SASPL_130613 [Salvia splendens]|uniref:PHD finger-like domain-containing protein 5A n=1 Tax=Salvia splendens TaxID=180675 RepID=A0A8X8X793_SALSN|nr:hypothetical protein SASPL_130613 [Salvia splendens]